MGAMGPMEERPRIVAVLNCFAPSGANVAQVVVRADQSLQFFNDEGLGRAMVRGLKKVKIGGRGRPRKVGRVIGDQ